VPRSFTSTQRTQLAASHYRVWTKVEVDAGSGWVDFTSLGGYDWFVSAEWTDSIDAPVMEGSITFAREHGALSLAPYVAGSSLNAGGPAIDGGAGIRLSVAHMAPGATPSSGDYVEVFLGYIDTPEWGGRDDGEVKCSVRDIGGHLISQWTEAPTIYPAATIEATLQAILDANPNVKLGPLTLQVPVSPVVNLSAFTLPVKPVLLAMRDIADQIGWTVKFRYNAAGDFLITFFEPDRIKAIPDYTLGPDEYEEVPDFQVPTDDVRNVVEIAYVDSGGANRVYRTTDSTSIAQYGPRFISIADTPNIDTPDEAEKMGLAVLADLKLPYATQEVVVPTIFWIVQTGDLIGFPQNTSLYDATYLSPATTLNLGVVRFVHRLTLQGEETQITCRQQVAGGIKTWIAKGGAQVDAKAPVVSLVSITQPTALAADITIGVQTFFGELATVAVSDTLGINWQLVVTTGDPTPRAVASGTEIGPTDWFLNGTTYRQFFSGYVLDPVITKYISVQATGTTSGLASPWTVITLAGGETTGGQNGGPTPTGVSVNVIIPVLLTDPADSPTVVAAGADTAFSKFSYDPAPFTKVRLDAEVTATGTSGGVAQLEYFDGTSWVAVTGATVPTDVVGLINGIAVPNTVVTEQWFRVVPSAAATLKSVWVTFLPRALSLPPNPFVPLLVCNSSLSGLADFGEDWCSYLTDADALTAYNWAEYPVGGGGGGTFWSDWVEPAEDIEGRNVGLYDNIAVPLAPDYQHGTLARGLPFNGGSTGFDVDSDVPPDATPDVMVTDYRGMRNSVPVNTYPNGSMPQAKVTLVARFWIDSVSDLSTAGNFVEPCYIGWASSGAFGECFVSIQRYAPYTNADAGTPHLWLSVESFNSANAYVYDCGSASGLIGDSVGHEYKLEAEIIPPTSGAFDKMRANLIINPLPGSASTFSGQWTITNQNLLNGSGTWAQTLWWGRTRRNAGGRVHTRLYSLEEWFGDQIWLGGSPASIVDSDITPAPNDTSVVTATAEDEFTPGTRRTGVTVPIDSAYTRYNDGGNITSFVKDGNGHALLALASDGSNTPRGGELVLPDVDGAWDLEVTSAVASAANSGAHIWLRESGTGKFVAFGLHNNGTNRRWSVWKNSGELYRSSTNLTDTTFHIAVERFSGSWYFYRYTPTFNTETNATVTSLFTVKADRIGFGGWAGSGGASLSFNYLRKTS
jgi:hypothetical protein